MGVLGVFEIVLGTVFVGRLGYDGMFLWSLDSLVWKRYSTVRSKEGGVCFEHDGESFLD